MCSTATREHTNEKTTNFFIDDALCNGRHSELFHCFLVIEGLGDQVRGSHLYLVMMVMAVVIGCEGDIMVMMVTLVKAGGGDGDVGEGHGGAGDDGGREDVGSENMLTIAIIIRMKKRSRARPQLLSRDLHYLSEGGGIVPSSRSQGDTGSFGEAVAATLAILEMHQVNNFLVRDVCVCVCVFEYSCRARAIVAEVPF